MAAPVDRARYVESSRDVRRRIDAYLAAYLRQTGWTPCLLDAVSYSLLAPGKRVRPALVVECCRAVGGATESALPAAAAVEMIHCFSLIHDDLPALDDSDLRRGRPSLHRHAGEALAVLAGDALFNAAFDVLATRVPDQGTALRLTRELAGANRSLVNGQVLDMLGTAGTAANAGPRVRAIHQQKTGALLRASVRMGAVCGGAAADRLATLTRFGDVLGLLFQIIDDIRDVTEAPGVVGKPTGRDREQGKLTYPGVFGLDASREEVHRLRREADSALALFGAAADPLRGLCDLIAGG